MPTHNETRISRYSAQQMYDLVADVAAYPQFLPWCAAARVQSVTPDGTAQVMAADLVISFKVFRERFGSKVVLHPDDFFIDTEGHQDDAKLKSVIKEIQSAGASLRIIGSYPEDS